MPARGAEIKADYNVIRGGQISNGRRLGVFRDQEQIGEIDVLPQVMRLWGLNDLDSNLITLFVSLNEQGKIGSFRFEKRSSI